MFHADVKINDLDVLILGAGSAGLTARREVEKKTKNYLIVNYKDIGTTCARVGCMPSKVLIQAADDFEHRKTFEKRGIHNASELTVNLKDVFAHVRSLRDRFTGGVVRSMDSFMNDHFINGQAKIIDRNTVVVNDLTLKAKKIIIAVGSSPIVPKPFQEFEQYLLTTDTLFEQENIPQELAIIGLGVIGLEIGQALSNLGVQTTLYASNKRFGGLTDPEIQDYAAKYFSSKYNIIYERVTQLDEDQSSKKLIIKTENTKKTVDQAVIAIGRKSNFSSLFDEGTIIEGLELSESGHPQFNFNTMKVKNLPWYIAGDSNGERPILHEAADEGRIAGFNSVRTLQSDDDTCFKRRTPLAITFSSPNIALIGKSHQQLQDNKNNFITSSVSFEGQGRSLVKEKNIGRLHLYAEEKSGQLLGCELIAPDGEHLAHLLAFAIEMQLTVFDLLKMPIYHPVVEEGLRTAIREAAKKVNQENKNINDESIELFRCQEQPSQRFFE